MNSLSAALNFFSVYQLSLKAEKIDLKNSSDLKNVLESMSKYYKFDCITNMIQQTSRFFLLARSEVEIAHIYIHSLSKENTI